jgi:hypothetical protein
MRSDTVMGFIARSLVLGLALLCQAQAQAQQTERRWGIAPYLGFHQPALKHLNDGLFRAPYEGSAEFIDPETSNRTGSFIYESPLPALNPGPIAGLEFRWRVNELNALVFGVGTWQASSVVGSVGNLPVQGALERVTAQRKADLSYNEYFLGWRRQLLTRPGRYRFYVAGTLHQLFDLDYREDFTTVFLSGDARTFRKSTVTLAQATGTTLLQGAFGGEWFIGDWLSLGLEGAFGLGLQKTELGAAEPLTDFLFTDNIIIEYPARAAEEDGRVEFKAEAGGEYQKLRLDFNGWKAVFKATIYF